MRFSRCLLFSALSEFLIFIVLPVVAVRPKGVADQRPETKDAPFRRAEIVGGNRRQGPRLSSCDADSVEGESAMRHSTLFTLLALLVAASAPARALDCANATTQAEINACAAEEYEEADASLNAAYKELMARLSDERDIQLLLRKAQRAWIAYRDAQCDFAAAGTLGGSMYPALRAGCLAKMTDLRTRELRKLLECEEGDPSCPAP